MPPKNIWAYTPSNKDAQIYPGYASLNAQPDGTLTLDVRGDRLQSPDGTSMPGHTSRIVLTDALLKSLALNLLGYLFAPDA